MEQLVRDYVGYLLKGIIKQQEQKDHELRKNVVQVRFFISFVCSFLLLLILFWLHYSHILFCLHYSADAEGGEHQGGGVTRRCASE